MNDWERALLNVAAVLHGDGGHWKTREMTPEEVQEECIRVWSETVKRWDKVVYEAREERDEALENARRTLSIHAERGEDSCYARRVADGKEIARLRVALMKAGESRTALGED